MSRCYGHSICSAQHGRLQFPLPPHRPHDPGECEYGHMCPECRRIGGMQPADVVSSEVEEDDDDP